MKKVIVSIVVICLVFAISVFAKNAIAKIILIKATRQLTGLGLNIKNMDVGLLKTWVRIDDLSIFNPSGFADRRMAYIPQVYIDYDLTALLKKQVHLERLALDLREFTVVRNSAGRLNVNSISAVSAAKRPHAVGAGRPKVKPDVRIDVLELRIDRVLYKDYTQSPAAVWEYPVNINERYENITDLDKMVKLVVTRAVVNTAISKLADLDITSLKNDLSGIIQKGKNIFKEAGSVEDIGQALQGVAQELENIFK